MSDPTKAIAVSKSVLKPLRDSAVTPFIFFDAVPANGIMEGVVTLTLAATAVIAQADEPGVTQMIPTVQAYLRTNYIGAMALRDALDNALRLAQIGAISPPEGPAN